MGYYLRAVIGHQGTLTDLAASLRSSPVEIWSGIEIVPWTDELFDALGQSDPASEIQGVHYGHSALRSLLEAASAESRLAYIEAEFFGGQGEQGAVVFHSGQVVWASPFGPVQPPIRAQSPISGALSQLGVSATNGQDEFDTVGLGLHRRTEDWL